MNVTKTVLTVIIIGAAGSAAMAIDVPEKNERQAGQTSIGQRNLIPGGDNDGDSHRSCCSLHLLLRVIPSRSTISLTGGTALTP